MKFWKIGINIALRHWDDKWFDMGPLHRPISPACVCQYNCFTFNNNLFKNAFPPQKCAQKCVYKDITMQSVWRFVVNSISGDSVKLQKIVFNPMFSPQIACTLSEVFKQSMDQIIQYLQPRYWTILWFMKFTIQYLISIYFKKIEEKTQRQTTPKFYKNA